MRKETRNVLLPLLAGACAGAIAAILFAPKTGRETRENLTDGTRRLRRRLEDQIDSLADINYVSDMVSMIKGRRSNGHEPEVSEFETHESGLNASAANMSSSSGRMGSSGRSGMKSGRVSNGTKGRNKDISSM